MARLVKVAVTMPKTATPGVTNWARGMPPKESIVAPELRRLIKTRKKRGKTSVKNAAIGVRKKMVD
jgi:hypothetical protein